MVDAADGLGEYGRDVEHLELRAKRLVLVLGNRVGDHNFVKRRCVDPRDGIAT
jgi:hypothetical protein